MLPTDGDAAVARLSLTVAPMLGLRCIGVSNCFVGHMAARVNVETVVARVGPDTQAHRRAASAARLLDRP